MRKTEHNGSEVDPPGAACERTGGTRLCWCSRALRRSDVDCVRENVESSMGAVRRAAKGDSYRAAPLGAGRLRLLRQMLTEAVALSCCGAVLGLLLALASTRELAHLHAFNLPLLESVRIDGSALVFTVLAAFACGVLFGLLPAVRVTALSLREGMQDAGRGSSGGKRHAWVRDGLVISELAFACILLVGAGLLIP